jgi:hypothetical protein
MSEQKMVEEKKEDNFSDDAKENFLDKKKMAQLEAVHLGAGFLYIVRRSNWPTDHYKLGETKDIMRRLNNYNGDDFFPIECIKLFVCTDSVAFEAEIRKEVNRTSISSKKGSKEFVHIELEKLVQLFKQFITIDHRLSTIFGKKIWTKLDPLKEEKEEKEEKEGRERKEKEENNEVKIFNLVEASVNINNLDAATVDRKFTFLVPNDNNNFENDRSGSAPVPLLFSNKINFRLDKLPPRKKLTSIADNSLTTTTSSSREEKEEKKSESFSESFSESLAQWPSNKSTFDAAQFDMVMSSTTIGKKKRVMKPTTLAKPGPGVNHDPVNGRWIGVKITGERASYSVNKYGDRLALDMACTFADRPRTSSSSSSLSAVPVSLLK